jgi:hypothetical protein
MLALVDAQKVFCTTQEKFSELQRYATLVVQKIILQSLNLDKQTTMRRLGFLS